MIAGLAASWLSIFLPARATAGPVVLEPTDSLSIVATVSWPEPIPSFVWERLDRGLPATIETQVEIWRRQAFWVDSNLGVWFEGLKFLRDPWTGAYRRISRSEIAVADSLPLLTSGLDRTSHLIPIDSTWCDSESAYEVVITRVVRPLTNKDVREVEGWLRRGGGSGSSSTLGLPRVLFGVVRELNGLGDRRRRVSSHGFHLLRGTAGRLELVRID